MKIILVHNKYQQAGGEDLVFQSEGALLEENGHQVEYIVFDNKDIRTAVDKLMSGLSVFYNFRSGQRLKKKIEVFQPDMIHVHNFFPLASPSIFFAAKRYNIPVVVTLHNYRLICPSASLFYEDSIYEKSIHAAFPWDAIAKGIYRNSRFQTAAIVASTRIHNQCGTWRDKVDKFIVLTDFARRKFQNSILKVSPEAFVVKPNFVVDYGLGQSVRENFFLYVGRLSVEKGLVILLESARMLPFKLVIIGDGPARNLVEKEVRTNNKIVYLGFQPKEVVMNYLKKCKALLIPSKWYEGMPMIILEAFATGTPVIASRLGAMQEIVQHHTNGLLFTAGDPKDLADALKFADAQPELMEKLSQQARETYLARYTPQINYTILNEIYTQVLNKMKVTKKF